MSQDEDQALDAAWRRASTADADRPAAKTRAAILSEAAAAARRRQPAANESRYWLGAVAGVAVIGVGVLLWRQADVRMPGEPPQMVVESAVEKEADLARTAEAVPAPEPSPETATAPPASPAELRQEAPAPAQALQRERARTAPEARGDIASAESVQDRAIGGEGAANTSPTQSALPPAPLPALPAAPVVTAPPQADEGAELNEVQITGTRIIRNAPRAVGPRAGVAAPARQAQPEQEAMQLLRSRFPALLDSDGTHRLWVVLDASGNVLLSGELEVDGRLEDLSPRIERDLGRPPGTWRTESVTNTRGRTIELAIARIP